MDYGMRIKEARLAKGWSQQFLADQIGATQSTINRIEKGQTTWSRSTAQAGAALGLDFAAEHGPFPGMRDMKEFSVSKTEPFVPSPRGVIPLYAAVEGGPGEMVLEKDPLSYVPRPHYLDDVENAYSVYISGDSMFPEFEPGDTAHVNPRLPPIPDTTCVFYTNDGTDDRAMIKRLVKITREKWRVRQWNPPQGAPEEFDVERVLWPTCHRVVGRVPRR